jgi:hypothetical protein
LDRHRDLLFYWFVIPILALTNLALAAIVVSNLHPGGWIGWLEAGTAGFCCGVAGWVAASLWSKKYWAMIMARHVATWRMISDTMLDWIADLPIPSDSVDRLRRSLEETALN